MTTTRRLTGVDGIAEYLELTPGAVRKLVQRRQIPFVRVGRLLRFDLRVIDEWIEDHATEAVS